MHRHSLKQKEIPSSSSNGTGTLAENTSSTNGKYNKIQKRTLWCILTIVFSSYATMALIAPFFPEKASGIGLSKTAAGLTFSIYAIVSVLMSPILGKVIPLVGAKNMLLTGVAANGIANIFFGLCGNLTDANTFFITSLALRIFEAFGTMCHITAAYTYVIKMFPDSVSYVFGLIETFIGIGLSLGPAIGGILYTVGGYGLPFYLFGVFILLCFPFSYYFLESIQDNEKEKLDANSDSNAKNEASYFQLIINPKVFTTSLVLVLMSSAQSYLFPTLENHMKHLKAKSEIVALEFFLCSGMYVVSTMVVGRLLIKVGRKFLIMLIGVFFAIAGLLVIGPSELLMLYDQNVWFTTAGLILMGLGFGFAFVPTFESFYRCSLEMGLQDSLSTYGKISGMWNCLFSLGESIGPLLGGFLVTHYNFSEASTVIAITCLICIPFLIVMVAKEGGEAKNKKQAFERTNGNTLAVE